jgi:hypothetical protein
MDSYQLRDLTGVGATLPEIMLSRGWRSPSMPPHYARRLSTQSGTTQTWLDTAHNRRSRS